MTENQTYLQSQIEHNVYLGLYPQDEIMNLMMEIIEDEEFDEIDESWVLNQIQAFSEKRAEDAKAWKSPTDVARLVMAFNVLCEAGIIALHNAGYTTSDAFCDAGEIYHDAVEQEIPVKGFCYYHGQDLERVLEGNGLMVGFDSMDGGPETRLTIGRAVFEALTEQGLSCAWEETENRRINIDMMWEVIYQDEETFETCFSHYRFLQE